MCRTNKISYADGFRYTCPVFFFVLDVTSLERKKFYIISSAHSYIVKREGTAATLASEFVLVSELGDNYIY